MSYAASEALFTYTAQFTTSQTNTSLVTLANSASKLVITRVSAKVSNAASVDVSVRIGFGDTVVPAYSNAGIIASHPGLAAGSGFVEGNGSGILGQGTAGQPLRLTCSAPSSGALDITVTGYARN